MLIPSDKYLKAYSLLSVHDMDLVFAFLVKEIVSRIFNAGSSKQGF